ncbi:hypothetical protein ACOJCM_18275 [Billgrantia sp. LNSP4103-1]|uniref:hypothetical protein n=1 Tax=Billgrantia sp. LNSP4103-1 TaxID=3410266 RepID=UPI00403F634A
MPYRIPSPRRGANPTLQVCDATASSVRLACQSLNPNPSLSEEERELLQLRREEVAHDLFRRLFLRTSERYLKGELPDSGLL